MINFESKTIREFSVKNISINGKTLSLFFGYDVGVNNSGYYIYAKYNNKVIDKRNKKELSKIINELNIPIFKKIFNNINNDIYMFSHEYVKNLKEKIVACDFESTSKLLKLKNKSEQQKNVFDFLKEIKAENKPHILNKKVNNFIKSYLLSNLEYHKNLIKDIRKFCCEGFVINNILYLPKRDGALLKSNNEFYYKRDIDSIRKMKLKIITSKM